jgi:hypothetical protein
MTKCMAHEKFELLTLFESIFQLEGNAFVNNREKIIELELNPKEPELMDELDIGLRILNAMDIHDLDGRFIQFNM